LDGVTGAGDGSGRWAALELRKRLRAGWRQQIFDPARALTLAAQTMAPPPATVAPNAAVVGIAVEISGRRITWAGVGDCRLYLIRARPGGQTTVTRLSAEDSLMAIRLRAGTTPGEDSEGVLTRALPKSPEHLYSGSAELRAGDTVVLLSDGACVLADENSFIEHWRFGYELQRLAARQPGHPPLLVSLLCRRADDMGGEDNATALAICCGEPVTLPPTRHRKSTLSADELVVAQ
jgi:serine/threonine protein phosphatase PrpC